MHEAPGEQVECERLDGSAELAFERSSCHREKRAGVDHVSHPVGLPAQSGAPLWVGQQHAVPIVDEARYEGFKVSQDRLERSLDQQVGAIAEAETAELVVIEVEKPRYGDLAAECQLEADLSFFEHLGQVLGGALDL